MSPSSCQVAAQPTTHVWSSDESFVADKCIHFATIIFRFRSVGAALWSNERLGMKVVGVFFPTGVSRPTDKQVLGTGWYWAAP